MSPRLTAGALLLSLATSWDWTAAALAEGSPTTPTAPASPTAPTPAPVEGPEPAPAPLEEPEPEPAPLRVEKTAAERAAEAAERAEREQQVQARAAALRAYSGVAWTGVALTLGLLVTGVTFGVLAQDRSDSLSRLSTQNIDGFPPVYSASYHADWLRLQDEGPLFSRVALGTLISAGVLAAGSGVLFWARERRFGKDLTAAAPLNLRLTGPGLALAGRF